MSTQPTAEKVMTRDAIPVEVGQVWRDLDTRQNGRTVTILEIIDRTPGYERVRVRTSRGVETRISVRRMYRHATGYELVK